MRKCQNHDLSAMWTTPLGTKKSERLWNNVIQTNLNYLLFFSVTVELKAREELQMLSAGPCKTFDTAPTTSLSTNCRDIDLMDALLSGWGLAEWLHPAGVVKGSVSLSRWQVVSLSRVVFSRAAILLKMGVCPNAFPKHRFYPEGNEM